MNKAAAQLVTIIEPAVNALGYELISCDLYQQGGRAIIRVYIDKENGVTIDDCTLASRQIGAALEVENALAGAYNLEVSSPGLDRPLVKIEHFTRFIGKQVRIKLALPLDGRRNFSGELIAVQDQQITINVDAEIFTLAFANIEKANLIPDI